MTTTTQREREAQLLEAVAQLHTGLTTLVGHLDDGDLDSVGHTAGRLHVVIGVLDSLVPDTLHPVTQQWVERGDVHAWRQRCHEVERSYEDMRVQRDDWRELAVDRTTEVNALHGQLDVARKERDAARCKAANLRAELRTSVCK